MSQRQPTIHRPPPVVFSSPLRNILKKDHFHPLYELKVYSIPRTSTSSERLVEGLHLRYTWCGTDSDACVRDYIPGRALGTKGKVATSPFCVCTMRGLV